MTLPDLPDDVLGIILGKVGEKSFEDFVGCFLSCKTFQRISKFPEVLQKLDLTQAFPPPWERIPENSQIIFDCAHFEMCMLYSYLDIVKLCIFMVWL
ncbi:unnamed protein product [Brassica napus]|uniref:(rape) hypothetical protein n=1 Tax=Brassica napus TaxID=3708 RepID=A0A816V178_BRANA|nr:unnamed protein product [Brassica napus]